MSLPSKLTSYLAAGRPIVAATFGLDRVAEAQEQLARRTHVGKLVVVPG